MQLKKQNILLMMSYLTSFTLIIYWIELALRTEWFHRAARVGQDVVVMVCVVGIVALGSVTLHLFLTPVRKKIAWFALFFAGLIDIIYLVLILIDKFGYFPKVS